MTETMQLEPHAMVIGALGGSGTRAVAEAFERLGYVHGPALNRSRDCLDFTYLFVRTDWMASPLPSIGHRLGVLRAVTESGHHPEAAPLDQLTDVVTERNAAAEGRAFLVKEPNTHMFADDILTAWPDAAFLFVHRHPLDMAFSSNTNQLKRWGEALGISAERSGSLPAAQLDVWIHARQAQTVRERRHGGRTASLNYERFVEAPVETLHSACRALGIKITDTRLELACRNVSSPDSRGRWREQDLSCFRDDQLAYCKDEGWL
ncbi:sulfotransferase family protein [Maricaulis maris]|uniref:sulfotransferase family protein n=1 Tax=Maricaulis maris TaxID=74318 RepID=UPI002926EEA0|nr:sulfotransferase family protein [Maricaulis maris]